MPPTKQGLHAMGVEPPVEAQFIINVRNRLRYLWAKHGGFDLMTVTEL